MLISDMIHQVMQKTGMRYEEVLKLPTTHVMDLFFWVYKSQ